MVKVDKRISVKDAAEILGVSPGRIRQMIVDGEIKDVEKFGQANSLLEDEIKSLKDTRRTERGRPSKKESGN